MSVTGALAGVRFNAYTSHKPFPNSTRKQILKNTQIQTLEELNTNITNQAEIEQKSSTTLATTIL